MANEKVIQSGTPGGGLSPRLVHSEITFDSNGDATVTASSIGLRYILGVSGNVWGGTADAVASVYVRTTFASGGVSTVNLECRESDGGTDANLTVTVPLIFWGVA